MKRDDILEVITCIVALLIGIGYILFLVFLYLRLYGE